MGLTSRRYDPEVDILCRSHADEFFRDVQADLKRRSATRREKPKSLSEELGVRATFTSPRKFHTTASMFLSVLTHENTVQYYSTQTVF